MWFVFQRELCSWDPSLSSHPANLHRGQQILELCFHQRTRPPETLDNTMESAYLKKKKRDEDRKITDKLSRHQWQTLKLISSFNFHLTWNNFFLWSPSFFSEKQYLFTYFVLWRLFLLQLSFLYKFQAFFSHKLFDHISLGLSVVSALCYSMMLPFSPLFVIWSLQNSTSCSSWPRTRYGFSKQFNYYWILSTQTH